MMNEQLFKNKVMNRLIEPKDHILVAVSAGPDSMGLLHYLYQLKSNEYPDLKLSVAHINHHSREKDNQVEEELVKKVCQSYHIPFYKSDFYYSERENFHEEARQFRYQTFIEQAHSIGANKLALAHHLDDQAETILFKLIRGSSLLGYSGMDEEWQLTDQLTIIRPFLTIYKDDILLYCQHHQIPYCEDSSNKERKYTRNKLRLDIIPQLMDIQSNLQEKMQQFHQQTKEANHYLNQLALSAYEQQKNWISDELSFSVSSLITLPAVLLRLVLIRTINDVTKEKVDPSFNKINDLMDIIHSPKPNLTYYLGNNYECVKAYNNIVFRMKKSAILPYRMEITDFIEYKLPINVKLNVKKTKEKLKINSNRLILCYNNFIWPIIVRTPQKGDRIETNIGHKKVNRIFIDHKIPLEKRKLWPIITDGNNRILWVVGLQKAKLTEMEDDCETLSIELKNLEVFFDASRY